VQAEIATQTHILGQEGIAKLEGGRQCNGWNIGGDENSTAEVYDPATGSFSITGGMEIGRSGHTATLLPNGRVLVAGGGVFIGLASAELYQ